jgi:hypothetical protein
VGTLLDDFLEIDAITGGIILYGFADHILRQVREKAPLGATVEEKTRAWWPQVHKQGLHTVQTSAWDLWSDVQANGRMMPSEYQQVLVV